MFQHAQTPCVMVFHLIFTHYADLLSRSQTGFNYRLGAKTNFNINSFVKPKKFRKCIYI